MPIMIIVGKLHLKTKKPQNALFFSLLIMINGILLSITPAQAQDQSGSLTAVITDTAIAWVNADIVTYYDPSLIIDELKVVDQTDLNALQGDITTGGFSNEE